MSKKVSAAFLLLAIFSYGKSLLVDVPVTQAAQLRDVVISEIAWAGSGDSASDEWIELYNNTSQTINLTNWIIEDDNGAQTYALQGTVEAQSYYLLESRETATSMPSNMVKSTSLSNTGDSLVIKDASQNIIDTVNSSSAAWFAGSNSTHATMERINLQGEGDSANNWRSGSSISSATSSNGGPIVGTPQSSNNGQTLPPSTPPSTTTPIVVTTVNPSPVRNDTDITVSFQIQNASNISNFGFDIEYDPTSLAFLAATEGDFLTGNGNTTFHSGLQNNQPGKVVVGSARTEKPLTGKNGNGTLFSLQFHTSSNAQGSTTLLIKPTSFLSSPTSHINISTWPVTTITIQNPASNTITNLRASPGTDRYTIELNWDSSSSGPFQVYKQNAHAEWQLLGTTTTNQFIDRETLTNGSNVIPHLTYHYRISTSELSTAQNIDGIETRGLKSDNNRSDRVDANDLEQIARLWTIDDTDSTFDRKVDTNFDALIGGEDLLDLAVDWAKTYQ